MQVPACMVSTARRPRPADAKQLEPTPTTPVMVDTHSGVGDGVKDGHAAHAAAATCDAKVGAVAEPAPSSVQLTSTDLDDDAVHLRVHSSQEELVDATAGSRYGDAFDDGELDDFNALSDMDSNDDASAGCQDDKSATACVECEDSPPAIPLPPPAQATGKVLRTKALGLPVPEPVPPPAEQHNSDEDDEDDEDGSLSSECSNVTAWSVTV
jgi:hypothetical protein